MEETNETTKNEIKEAIINYYMRYINERFAFSLDIDNRRKTLMQELNNLIEAKLQQGESIITKHEVENILEEVLERDTQDSFIRDINSREIREIFPEKADVKISGDNTVQLQEEVEKILEPNELKQEYIFVKDGFYDERIQGIESRIKELEKQFSTKDLERFNIYFDRDVILAKQDIEKAEAFEQDLRQRDEKIKKFEAVKEKMIHDYGRRYNEILAQDIPQEEKDRQLRELLEETRSYESKTEIATQQAQEEFMSKQQGFNRFDNKEKEDILKDMKKRHLFDRDKYLEDRKGEQNPELAELYQERLELNQYREEKGLPIHEIKPNIIVSMLNRISQSRRQTKQPLLLEYNPENDIPTGVNPIIDTTNKKVDEQLIKTLANLYGEHAKEKDEKIDTKAFEEHLQKYFRIHYEDLKEEGYNHFLNNFAEMPDEIFKDKEEGELSKIAKEHGIDPKIFNCFGYKFSIRDGLIYENEIALERLEKVYYATPEGINSVINDLYSEALYEKHSTEKEKSLFVNDSKKKLKNGFIEYAKQHGIEIENEYTLEKMQVNQEKVESISKYLNEIINEQLARYNENYQQADYTQAIAEDITENYSTIMNVEFYNFGQIASVKNIMGDTYLDDAYLDIAEDSILRSGTIGKPIVVYATPEYCAREYQNIMEKIKNQNETIDPFLDGMGNIKLKEENNKKTALREYIKEHRMDIDISVEQVPVNQERINQIADALVEKYGDKAKEPKTFRDGITRKLQENWSEIMTEMQIVDIGETFKEELQEDSFITDELYVTDDFAYTDEGLFHRNDKCIYATPEVLKKYIRELDKKISQENEMLADDDKRQRNILMKYAKDNNIKIDKNAKERIQQMEEQRRYNRSFLGRIFNDTIPDDPTAREKLELEDTGLDTLVKMAEGNPGAITAITQLLNESVENYFLILGLDDMNIRGSQIWQVYKYYCGEDVNKFKKVIQDRDADMIRFLNEQNAFEGNEKAVSGGASFDRNKRPNAYRFSDTDVELYKQAREERMQEEREKREQIEKDKREHKDKKRYIKRRIRTKNIEEAKKKILQQQPKSEIEEEER